MRRLFSLLLVFPALLPCAPARSQEKLTVTRRITLPDGGPAVGAKVTVRTWTPEKLLDERQVQTDANGGFTAEVLYERPAAPMQRRGCLVIDMPGYALTLANLPTSGSAGGGRAFPPPPMPGLVPAPIGPGGGRGPDGSLRLAPAYQQSGQVLDPQGAPAAGATVTVRSVGTGPFGGGFPANVPEAGIAMPELVAKTGADGTFTLRGLAVENMGYVVPSTNAAVWARVDAGGKVFAGGNERFFFRGGAQPGRQPSPDTTEIRLVPCYPVSGRVLNSATGAPVAGANVHLLSEPAFAAAVTLPVMTDADGRYLFPGVPSANILFVQASHPDLAGAWEFGFRGAAGPQRKGFEQAVQAPDVRLTPWGTVAGSVVDEVTGKAVSVPLHVACSYTSGYNDGEMAFTGQSTTAAVRPDGSFTLKAPLGHAVVRVYGPGYHGTGGGEAAAAGGAPMVLKAQRDGGALVHLTGVPLERLARCEIRVRGGGRPETSVGNGPNISDGYWFCSANMGSFVAGGQPMEVQIVGKSRDDVILPWTPLDLQTKEWPLEIQVPQGNAGK